MSEQPIDTLVALINQRLDSIEAKLDKVNDDHESRIRSLEKWSYAIPPSLIVAVISAVVAFLR